MKGKAWTMAAALSAALVLAGLAAVVMVFVGCTSTEALGRFTVISSKNAGMGRMGEFVRHHEISKTSNMDLNLRIFWFVRTRRVSESYELENTLDSVTERIPGGIALVDAPLSA